MKILHTITCTRYVPSYNAHEQFTRHLTRPRRLTDTGCERILRAEDRANNAGETPAHPIHVVLTAAGHPLPRIPEGSNTATLPFTTADGRPAIAVNQIGFARTAADDEQEVNGLAVLICMDDPAPPDAPAQLATALTQLLTP